MRAIEEIKKRISILNELRYSVQQSIDRIDDADDRGYRTDQEHRKRLLEQRKGVEDQIKLLEWVIND